MKIQENNKLIAEFIGYKKGSDFQYLKHPETGFDTDIDSLPYHFDWNWLMPVVEKCLKTCPDEMYDLWRDAFINKFLTFDISLMHEEVIFFIKWYDKNKLLY